MLETIIICSTVLLVWSTGLAFGWNFLKTSKQHKEEVKQEAIAATAGLVEKALSGFEEFKDLFKEDVKTLTENQIKLNDKLQKIEVSAGMSQTQVRGGIVDQFRRQNVGK